MRQVRQHYAEGIRSIHSIRSSRSSRSSNRAPSTGDKNEDFAFAVNNKDGVLSKPKPPKPFRF
jgi:hypothetical protein